MTTIEQDGGLWACYAFTRLLGYVFTDREAEVKRGEGRKYYALRDWVNGQPLKEMLRGDEFIGEADTFQGACKMVARFGDVMDGVVRAVENYRKHKDGAFKARVEEIWGKATTGTRLADSGLWMVERGDDESGETMEIGCVLGIGKDGRPVNFRNEAVAWKAYDGWELLDPGMALGCERTFAEAKRLVEDYWTAEQIARDIQREFEVSGRLSGRA